eukprot:1929628-Heterocapsa_arctica.AAC.1
MEVHLLIDVHPVYLSTTAPEMHVPNEKQLMYAVQSHRDHLEADGSTFSTTSTDATCAADALTKGVITRST